MSSDLQDDIRCAHKYDNGRWAIVMHGTAGVCALCGMIFN